jgi:hypothetical protein
LRACVLAVRRCIVPAHTRPLCAICCVARYKASEFGAACGAYSKAGSGPNELCHSTSTPPAALTRRRALWRSTVPTRGWYSYSRRVHQPRTNPINPVPTPSQGGRPADGRALAAAHRRDARDTPLQLRPGAGAFLDGFRIGRGDEIVLSCAQRDCCWTRHASILLPHINFI